MASLFGFGQSQQQAAASPSVVAPPPDRTDAETAQLAARQKQRFTGAGSFTRNFLTGGQDTSTSTAARLLGGA